MSTTMSNVEKAFDKLIRDSAKADAHIDSHEEQDGQTMTAAQAAQATQSVTNKNVVSRSNPESIIRDTTRDYVRTLVVSLPDLVDESTDEAYRIHDELMTGYETQFDLENAVRKVNHKSALPCPNALPPQAAAQIVLATGDVRVMRIGSEGNRLIMKQYYKNADTGWHWKWAGYWTIVPNDEEASILMRVFRLLCPSARPSDAKIYMSKLHDARDCVATQDPDLVFFRNGVWDYKSRTFTEYDDPQYDKKYPTQISLGKLPVYHPLGKAPRGKVAKMNPDGTCEEPVLHDRGDGTFYWRPSQMLTDPFDMNTETGKAANLIIWQAMQFLIRKRNSDFGYYHFWVNAGGGGRNGKGTIWDMMHRLIEKPINATGDEDLGKQDDRVIPLAVDSLGQDYTLAQNILTAYAIVGEESDGSVTYIDNCSIAKMLARKQEMTFRIIREAPFKFAFDGFLLQQSNKAPIFSEKNDSVISHTIVIPFEKTFPKDKAYVKKDYVLRDVVASWLAYKLTVDMPQLNEYDAEALKVLEPYKREMLKASMNTFQFCDDVLPGIPLDVIPNEFLYALYQRWCVVRGVTGRAVVSFRTFQQDMEQYGLNNDHRVIYTTSRKLVKTGSDTAWSDNCRALEEFGNVPGLPTFEYSLATNINTQRTLYKLNSERLMGKLWNRGCLVRQCTYADMGYDLDGAEEQDEANQDEAMSA